MATIRKDSQNAYEITREFSHNGIDYTHFYKVYPEDNEYEPCFHRITFKFMNIRFVVNKNFNSSRTDLIKWIDNFRYRLIIFGLSHFSESIDSGEIRFSWISYNPLGKYHTISIRLR